MTPPLTSPFWRAQFALKSAFSPPKWIYVKEKQHDATENGADASHEKTMMTFI